MTASLLSLPLEIWIKIALAAGRKTDEYVFNSMARAISALGRYTIAADAHIETQDSVIINRRLDLMITFGYTVRFYIRSAKAYKDTNYICWQRHKYCHRNDVPAITTTTNIYEWCKYGEYHRTDGPATIDLDANEYSWYQNGKHHRVGGPSYIDSESSAWFQNNELHRDDGPAFIASTGSQYWYQHGKHCNKNGPATVHPDGKELYCICSAARYGKQSYHGHRWCGNIPI